MTNMNLSVVNDSVQQLEQMQNKLETLIEIEPVFTTLALSDGAIPTVKDGKFVCESTGHPSMNEIANVCMKPCEPVTAGSHILDGAC